MRGVLWIGAAALASKEPVSHLEPARCSPLWPRLPDGPRLADSCQRHSLGGSGFVKADAWRCMDSSRGIGEQEPISHLDPARRSSPLPYITDIFTMAEEGPQWNAADLHSTRLIFTLQF